MRWPVVTFAMPGVVISELEAVIRELESVFLIFLNNYSYVANRRHIHGTNKGNAGGCKKTVLCALISVFMLTFTPEQEYGKVSAKKRQITNQDEREKDFLTVLFSALGRPLFRSE